MFRNLSPRGLGITGSQSEMIELALSFRFRGMDLNIQEFRQQVDNYGLDHARRLIDSAQIKVGAFAIPFAWDHWEDDESGYKLGLEELATTAGIVSQLGCSRCITDVQPASDERPYHENFEFHRRRLTEIADVLGKHDIKLGIGFQAPVELRAGRAFQFIHTMDALIQLAKMSENVGIVLDIWQLHVSGGSLADVQEVSADDIVYLKLSDVPEDVNIEEIAESRRLLPGVGGTIDSSEVVKWAADLGFEGPVAPVTNRKAYTDVGRDALVRMAGKHLDAIWERAGLDSKGNPIESPQPTQPTG